MRQQRLSGIRSAMLTIAWDTLQTKPNRLGGHMGCNCNNGGSDEGGSDGNGNGTKTGCSCSATDARTAVIGKATVGVSIKSECSEEEIPEPEKTVARVVKTLAGEADQEAKSLHMLLAAAAPVKVCCVTYTITSLSESITDFIVGEDEFEFPTAIAAGKSDT